MIVYLDADACAVKKQALQIAKQFKDVKLYAVASTAHKMPPEFETIVCNSFDQSVDIEILKRAKKGDLVVTQDYDLASMLLDRKVKVIHPNGWFYTKANIIARIANRSFNRLMREKGYKRKKLSAKKKRRKKNANRERFEKSFKNLIDKSVKRGKNENSNNS